MARILVGLAGRWRACRCSPISLLAIAALQPAPAAAAPGVVHQAWGVREGLPVDSVTRVIQNRQGYVWLTTYDGLVRFDGVRFVTYHTTNTPGLPSNRLIDVLELPDGALLLVAEGGAIALFDPTAGTATTVPLPRRLRPGAHALLGPGGDVWMTTHPGAARLRDGALVPVEPATLGDIDVSVLTFDGAGELWAGTTDQGVWHLSGGGLRRFDRSAGLRSNRVKALRVDATGAVWVGSERGVDVIRAGEVTPLRVGGEVWSAEVLSLDEAPSGGMLIGTETGLFRCLDGALARVDPGDLARSPTRTMAQAAAAGGEWVATGSAVFRDGLEVLRLGGTPPWLISSIARDHEGSLWISTNGDGLHRLRPALFESLSVGQGLTAREVYTLAEDARGALWIGTQKGGLNRYQDGAMVAFGAADGLLDDNVKAILEDRGGTLWVGTYEEGLFRRVGERFVREPGAGRPQNRIFALFEDRDGSLWAGTEQGLFHRQGQSWQGQSWQRQEEGREVAATVRAIRQSADGALWLATDRGGIGRLAGGRVEWLTTAQGLASDHVRDIYPLGDRTVWVAAEEGGLSRVSLTDGAPLVGARVVVVRASDGLPVDGIHQIVADGFGWLWMSTNQGIFRVALAQLEDFAAGRLARVDTEMFTERDGLLDREANGGVLGAAIRSRDGRLWFATQDGVAGVDPRPDRLALPPAPVVIEGLVAGDREYRGAFRLALPPKERSFRVDYAALSLLAPERVRFRYRLEGFDENWVEAGLRRSAYYTNVPPGEYTFRLQAANGAVFAAPGESGRSRAELPLTVRPYYHETAWFRALLVAIALSLLVGAHLARTGWLQRQRRQLERLVELRTRELEARKVAAEHASQTIAAQAEQLRELDRQKSRFFADISHELRTPLTLILGPLEEVRRGEVGGALTTAGTPPAAVDDVLAGAVANTRSLLDLTNQLLDLATLEAGKLRLETAPTDLGLFLREIATRFEPLARERGLRFTLDVADPPPWATIDRRQMVKVVDNLLVNAIKFTPAGGAVRLVLREEAGGDARIGVIDEGQGIAPEHLPHIFERFYQAEGAGNRLQPGTGIGLALVDELTTLHGGQLEVESDVGTGTSFWILLPRAVADPEPVVGRVPPEPVASGALAADVAGRAGAAEPPVSAPTDADIDADADRTTVLVVDDHADTVSYVRRHLERRYRVLTAGDGLEALALARVELPDLVVTDLTMPRLDGLELTRELKSDAELDWVPVILLTARAGIEDRLVGLGAEADDYLTKPFDARELVARVDNLIASRRRLRLRFGGAPVPAGTVLDPDTDPDTDPGGEPLPVPSVALSAEDQVYRRRLLAVIDEHLADEGFRVVELARAMAQDRSHLFRRVRAVAGEAPSDLIRRRRLERARELLASRAGQVSEIAYAVGFNSVSYFSKCFRERFGRTPSEHLATMPGHGRSDPGVGGSVDA